MRTRCALVCACGIALLVGASVHAGNTIVETFDGGSNLGGWTYGSPNGFIDPAGGNPGAYFHDPFVDTFAPQPHTTQPSIFTGDYRAGEVTSVGIDLITHSVDFSAGDRPLSVLLVSDNSTPADFDDDWAAYMIGPANIPLPGEGWMSYDFIIPSQSQTLPAGWGTLQFGPDSPVNPDWNDVITNVTELRFFYGDPTFFFIFQGWNVGFDNVRMTVVPGPGVLAMVVVGSATLRRRRRPG
jgi:hypothetical protein